MYHLKYIGLWARSRAQVVEHLLCEFETLSSNPSSTKIFNKHIEREREL
jgi:hypothetical protein